ncbi:MAG: glycoside hydrolase family 38 C-terminal domain-containing protein, partial [Victivallaceae bacterium]|nr:glycoside hydrolase family 38 C-terminal domain-containing protein [Victivallaceae bacterium]
MYDKECMLLLDRARRTFTRTKSELFSSEIVLNAQFGHSCDAVPYKERKSLAYRAISEGERWGEPWDSAWFHLTGAVPAEWKGKPIALHLNFSGEALIFDAEGVPAYGLTNSSLFAENYTKEIYQLTSESTGAEKIDLWVETAANSLFGMEMDSDPARRCPKPYGDYNPVVRVMRVGLFNLELWHLRLDMEVLIGMADALGHNDYRACRIVRALNDACDLLKNDMANASAARKALKKVLSLPALKSAVTANAVGHAHIDVGWLWPVKESIRKAARTFASALDLMKKYPGYVFGESQPQLYEFVKEHYPELYEKVKARVAEGRWELQGGMWVEADCNIISGESMVRQFLYGKNFFMDEFGVDVRNLWIPDVFGYSGAMPQIIRKSGCDYFLTQKISWNQFNVFPYNTFYWKGIDGTRVLTHFPPENNYNSELNPAQMVPGQNRMAENDFQDEYMTLFGIGDGGGGPKEEHVERGLRLANLEGNPKVKFGRACDFFRSIERKFSKKFPEWVGELYLELHRGTLTTQSRVKRGNRKLEQSLTAVELLLSAAALGKNRTEEIGKIWKHLMTNQFHDILPGSSIGKVYTVTEREHQEGLAACAKLAKEAAQTLFSHDEKSLVAVNTLGCDYRHLTELPAGWEDCVVTDGAGKAVAVETVCGKAYAAVSIPATGSVELRRGAKRAAIQDQCDSGKLVLENALIRYEFSREGRLLRAWDKEAGRSVLNGDGNDLVLYSDRPNNWEAWDIDVFYTGEKLSDGVRCVKAERVFAGALRQELVLCFEVGEHSKMTQHVVLERGSKRLDFATKVDWHEERKMLRVGFPVDVFTSEGTFDIQYGYARRATHRNTSWEFAKFEVAAQRYADLSEGSYGAAVLNDCKYGWKVRSGVIDLCLLRSPKYPDWDADLGAHEFTYAFLPHNGGFIQSHVIEEAAMLNRAPFVFDGFAGTFQPPCHVEGDNISLEVIIRRKRKIASSPGFWRHAAI